LWLAIDVDKLQIMVIPSSSSFRNLFFFDCPNKIVVVVLTKWVLRQDFFFSLIDALFFSFFFVVKIRESGVYCQSHMPVTGFGEKHVTGNQSTKDQVFQTAVGKTYYLYYLIIKFT